VVVTAGLIIRAIPLLEAAPGEGQEPALQLSAQETLGVGAMVLSAAVYAALGVCYEVSRLLQQAPMLWAHAA
jgi:hypothetical protein